LKTDIISIHRTFEINDSQQIHEVLLYAFEPYRILYTEEAFNATVVSTGNLVKRIEAEKYEVITALYRGKICGTVSVKKTRNENLYVASMAVLPEYHGNGIGYKLLEEAEKTALQKDCKKIVLETSEPITNAIRLYEKFGFKRTGKIRDWFGVPIFKMMKRLKP